jgi:hypothetical protein
VRAAHRGSDRDRLAKRVDAASVGLQVAHRAKGHPDRPMRAPPARRRELFAGETEPLFAAADRRE